MDADEDGVFILACNRDARVQIIQLFVLGGGIGKLDIRVPCHDDVDVRRFHECGKLHRHREIEILFQRAVVVRRSAAVTSAVACVDDDGESFFFLVCACRLRFAVVHADPVSDEQGYRDKKEGEYREFQKKECRFFRCMM